MNRKTIVAVVVLILIITLNSIIFDKFLNTSYIRWYISIGALIGLASSFFGLVWDLDTTPDYISLNPFLYLATCFWLVSVSGFSSFYPILGSAQRDNRDKRIKSSGQEGGCLVSFMNSALYHIFAIIINLIILGWLILVVPIQYFTFVLCGAPAREFIRRKERVMVNIKNRKLKLVIIDENNRIINAFDTNSMIRFKSDAINSPHDGVGSGWWDATPNRKPVTVTNLFSSVFFIVLGRILDLVQTLV